jgi:rhodanese-related sulfurtransferase
VDCTKGHTSSLAASALLSLGLRAHDTVGGVHAWRDGGLPVVAGPTPLEHVVNVTNTS